MFRKLFQSLCPKPRKQGLLMAAAFQAPATIHDVKPGNVPVSESPHQAPNQSWIDHAYPLKQVAIEIHGSAETTLARLNDELDHVFLKLIKGDAGGEGGDGGITYRFDYQEQVPGPSFFDEPELNQSVAAPATGLVLVVRLQGTRHSNYADINNLIASVMNEINSNNTSGQAHDDDFGYAFTLKYAPSLN